MLTLSDDDNTVLSSSNTSSSVSYTIYPDFEVVLDVDDNGINDLWEMPLVEKFCPMIILNHQTHWIAPEPVEYLGISKSDLWFILYNINGQQVGDYPITEQALFTPPISTMHPWISNPVAQNYSSLTGNAYNYVGQPPGKANGTYRLRFHYNYAGNAND